MADLVRISEVCNSEEDAESGEDLDDDLDVKGGVDSSMNLEPSTTQKRKRGRVWQSVNVENELVSTLSKVSTEETGFKPSPFPFVDLDDPSTAASGAVPGPSVFQNSAAVRGDHARLRPGGYASGSRKPRASKIVSKAVVVDGEIGAGDIGEGSSSRAGTSGNIGAKRKNVMTPKAKRRSAAEDKKYFSFYPDLSDEIRDEDDLHVAARKAVFQLAEQWNPWTITQIVSHLGNAEARKLLQLTKTIEQNGGMLTKDTLTRRTPGGVFITLFKADAEKKYGKDVVKQILAPQPGAPPKPSAKAKHERALAKRAQRRAEAAKNRSHAEQPMDLLTDLAPSATSAVVEGMSLCTDDNREELVCSKLLASDIGSQEQTMDNTAPNMEPTSPGSEDVEDGEVTDLVNGKDAPRSSDVHLADSKEQLMDIAAESNYLALADGADVVEMEDVTPSLPVKPDNNVENPQHGD